MERCTELWNLSAEDAVLLEVRCILAEGHKGRHEARVVVPMGATQVTIRPDWELQIPVENVPIEAGSDGNSESS